MELFFDLDGVMYNTFAELQKENPSNAEIIMAELNAKPMEGAKETLVKLHNAGHHSHICTARGLISQEEVKNTFTKLKADGLAPYLIAVAYGQTNKMSGILGTLKALPERFDFYNDDLSLDEVFFVDDDPKHVLGVAQYGVRCALFASEDSSRIKEVENQPNIYVVKNWKEIYDLISNLTYENNTSVQTNATNISFRPKRKA